LPCTGEINIWPKTVAATRKASKEELIETGLKRLDSMPSFGVTTVEGKNGDIMIFEYPNHEFIPYHAGVNRVEKVIKKAGSYLKKGDAAFFFLGCEN
jgi:imidazolonepropionase-like amidohydrolase